MKRMAWTLVGEDVEVLKLIPEKLAKLMIACPEDDYFPVRREIDVITMPRVRVVRNMKLSAKE